MIALETWRDQNQKAYFVTDSVIMDRFRPGWVYDTTDQEPEQSDTIEGLAEKLKVDPKELKKTVDEFNAAINDKEFDVMKLDGKATSGLSPNKTNWANPIKKAPFYGYPMKAQLTFTYGGLKVCGNCYLYTPNGLLTMTICSATWTRRFLPQTVHQSRICIALENCLVSVSYAREM
jgi:hypothetical protein